jgi:hypothetical protein
MPAKYEAIRDKMEAQGKPAKAAKTAAAKIFNATRKPGTAPVTGKPDAATVKRGFTKVK